MKLDLGCGQSPREGYVGVDLFVSGQCPSTIVKADLLRTWPWKDNSVEGLSCSHFIEHIPMTTIFKDSKDKDLLFFFFDEAWRVIRHAGIFFLQWPALQSVRAFQDPTHRRFIPLETLNYLDADWRKAVQLDHYNVRCNWKILKSGMVLPEGMNAEMTNHYWNHHIDYYAELQAIK